MKISNYIFVVILSFVILPLNAQFSLNGTVQMNKYAGLQPSLVDGVSALPATGNPLLRHVYLVDKNILAITIDEQAIILSNFKPYTEQPGDKMVMGAYHGETKYLDRNGERIGYLCGLNNSWFRPFNSVSGEKLDLDFISNTGNIVITSIDDASYSEPASPSHIYRKTVPVDRSHRTLGQVYPLRHDVFLEMSDPLTPGNVYQITIENTEQIPEKITFYLSEQNLRSEAIHVNMAGYAPDDIKIARYSMWLGDGGAMQIKEPRNFYIVKSDNNEIVFRGTSKLKSNATTDIKSYSNTWVHEMDFTALKQPGSYKVVVENVGCSFHFEISPALWENSARLLMKGFLHQRSGIELGPPYTDYQRPRNMHPEDELTIHLCDTEKFFSPEFSGGGQSNVFERIQASILKDTEVPQAWGGWMDAGDFDQRMSHLYSVRRMMYLYEMNPDYFESFTLNIPESNNTIPDILDEGRWCLDIYKRTQGVYEKGGVSWWIESIEHPRGGESSWLNSLPTALVPPTPRASLCYAATAGQMALVTRNYNKQISDDYLRSALEAMEWTYNNPDAPDVFGRSPREIYEALACIQLYRLTGDKKWHNHLEELIEEIFPAGIEKNVSTGNVEVLYNYLLVKEQESDPKLKAQARKAIIKLADELLEGASQNAYNILQHKNSELNRMATLSGFVLPVVAASSVTGEEKYTEALVQTVQYTFGNNPMNRVYISGIGERFFYPYQIDWEANNMAIPAGIPTFGPIIQTEEKWGWTGIWAIEAIQDAGLYPNRLLDWPHAEKCFNQVWIAPTNEFTVRTPMGELLLLTGYLAQNESSKKQRSKIITRESEHGMYPGGINQARSGVTQSKEKKSRGANERAGKVQAAAAESKPPEL